MNRLYGEPEMRRLKSRERLSTPFVSSTAMVGVKSASSPLMYSIISKSKFELMSCFPASIEQFLLNN